MNPLMQPTVNGAMQSVQQLMHMMRGKDPGAVTQMMARQNPQFAQFMRECQGKTPEQVAQQYGVDWNAVKQMMK